MQTAADVIMKCLLYSVLVVHLDSSTRAGDHASRNELGGDLTVECTVGPDDKHIPCEHKWTSRAIKPRHSGQLSAIAPLLRQCRRITKLTFKNVPAQKISSSFLAHTNVTSLTVIDHMHLYFMFLNAFLPLLTAKSFDNL